MYSVVGSDGQVYGPVDMATLSRWIAEGRIVPTTELIDPIDGRRIQAQQAPALMGSFPSAAPGYPPQAGMPMSYGYPRPDMMAYSGPPKSKVAAALLAFFLGGFGIHRFYLGHTGTGVAMLILCVVGLATCGITSAVVGVWALVDFVLILTGSLREPNGRELA